MSEQSEPPTGQEGQEKTSVESLRDEFRKQFDEMKTSFDSEIQKLKKENEDLKLQNNELNRALVRSATVPEPEAPKPKTEEELYRERVEELAKRTLERMKS